MAGSPRFDDSALERLQRLGGNELLRDMIDLFLEESARRLSDARAGHRAQDLELVEAALHGLTSSAGNVGACEMEELARHGAELARTRHGEEIAEVLARLEAAAQRTAQLLRERRPPSEEGKA
jgi:HPt (histidine-containing phosphotransfer) domain-containing protein